MSGESYGVSLRTTRSNRKLVLSAILIVATWEIVATIVARQVTHPEIVMPSLERIALAFSGLSDYWQGGLGVGSTAAGGKQTTEGALLALGYHTLVTASRLALGWTIAIVFGIGLGLVVGYFRSVRRFAFAPVNLLGLLPWLALVPLFAFWFGPTTEGVAFLVGLGAGILLLRVTLNAVENVPKRYVQAAQTLGASRWRLYRTIIIPATLPELRGGLTVAVTFSWTFVVAAELIGVQSGLGRLMFLAFRFTLIDRMVIIAVVFVLLASLSIMAFNRAADWVIRWAK